MILYGSNLTAEKNCKVIYKKTPAVCRGEGEEGETCECALGQSQNRYLFGKLTPGLSKVE
jgi:hypothetical protein